MENYIAYMNKKDLKTALKLLFWCAVVVFALGAVAYANTRFNGFADVQPASYYTAYIRWLWERMVENLFLYPKRFINFFN